MSTNKPKVICICGSSKFKAQILGITQRETLKGRIAINHGFFHHQDLVPLSDEQKNNLDTLMFRKIDISDEIFIVNVNGYMGKTTIAAIEYARQMNKPVHFLEDPEQPQSPVSSA